MIIKKYRYHLNLITASEYKFEIFEKIDDTQTQQIFSGIFYEDDYFQDEFIINQSSTIEIKLNDNIIYSSEENDT